MNDQPKKCTHSCSTCKEACQRIRKKPCKPIQKLNDWKHLMSGMKADLISKHT